MCSNESGNPAEAVRWWYEQELLRYYVPNAELEQHWNTLLTAANQPILLYSDEPLGKTTFLTAWQPESGKKILVNCKSDDAYLYWPQVAWHIVKQILLSLPDQNTPELPADSILPHNVGSIFLKSDQDQECFRCEFRRWLAAIAAKETLYIVINDLDVLNDDSTRYLSWLPVQTQENLHLIVSANKPEMRDHAEKLGWHCERMPPFPADAARQYVRNWCNDCEIMLTAEQLDALLHSRFAANPSLLKFVIGYLLQTCKPETYSQWIASITKLETNPMVYEAVFSHATANMSSTQKQALLDLLWILRLSDQSFTQAECRELIGASALDFIGIRWICMLFGLIRRERIYMLQRDRREFVDTVANTRDPAYYHNKLGDFYRDKLIGAYRFENAARLAKLCLEHYRKAKNWKQLISVLSSSKVLKTLAALDWQTVRACWVDLLLFSDVDLEEELSLLISLYSELEEKEIAFRCASLFLDLQMHRQAEDICASLDIDGIRGSLDTIPSRFSKENCPVYEVLTRAAREKRYDWMHKVSTHRLKSSIPEMERCYVLSCQADSLDHLRRYDQMLVSAEAYYRSALRCGSALDIHRALCHQGTALYHLEQYDRARSVQTRAAMLALEAGDLLPYLQASKIKAMCLYRLKQYGPAAEELAQLLPQLNRAGIQFEMYELWLNLCDAKHQSGDTEGAVAQVRCMLSQLPVKMTRQMEKLEMAAQVHYGLYLTELKEYQQAKDILRKTILRAEKSRMDPICRDARNTLLRLYKDTGRIMAAVDLREDHLTHLWMRGEYDDVAEQLLSLRNLLLEHHYWKLAKRIFRRWEQKFLQLTDGSRYIFGALDIQEGDIAEFQTLQNARNIAIEAGDLPRTVAYSRMAVGLLYHRDPVSAIQFLMDTAVICRNGNEETLAQALFEDAVVLLFDNGSVQGSGLYDALSAYLDKTAAQSIMELWTEIGSMMPQRDENWTILLSEDSQVPVNWKLIHGQYEKYPYLVFQCALDLMPILLTFLTAKELQALTNQFDENGGRQLIRSAAQHIGDTMAQDIAWLMRTFNGPYAERLLAYYENTLVFLQFAEHPMVASLSAELALIFRRRKDIRKTVQYHRLAIEAYQKQEKIWESLAEQQNLATSYRAFDKKTEAIWLLRQGMEKTGELGMYDLHGTMAGLLAELFTESKDPKDLQEVPTLFEIAQFQFEAASDYHKLAKCLLNQAGFFQDKTGMELSFCLKLFNAGLMIRKFRMEEHMQLLQHFETVLESMQGHKALMAAAMMIHHADVYRPEETITLENGTIHCVCKPKEPLSGIRETLHWILLPEDTLHIGVVAEGEVYREEHTIDALQIYADAWNAADEYILEILQDPPIFQAILDLQGFNTEDLLAPFLRFLRLWEFDKEYLCDLSAGRGDLEYMILHKRSSRDEE